MTDARLIRLRIELFTAAQSLTGEDAAAFWTLIDEVASIKRVMDAASEFRAQQRTREQGA